MALTKTKKVTITGRSMIGDAQAVVFTAAIDSDDPSRIALNDAKVNVPLYQANLAECRADQAEFEDYAFSVQAEMAAEAEAGTGAEAEAEEGEEG